MTLEAGPGPDETRSPPEWKDVAPSIGEAATLGEGLRQARLRSGKTLAELSAETKVHVRYLTAFEQNDWSSLPSRVFAIGYVRAYAAALGLDEQLAIERFKRESPDTTTPLKAPIGIAFEDVRRQSPRIVAAVAVVILAFIGWNVFQRISLLQAPRPSDIASVPDTWARDDDDAVIDLGAPRAAPPDQTTPALYLTPGLEAQMTGVDPEDPDAVAAAMARPPEPVQKAFNPRGAVYGESANASRVIIQARKPGALVIRLGDGQALFARQMAQGEAWRAPMGTSATVDVSDPAAFDVYLNGEYGGPLTAVLTPLSQLNSRAEQSARQLADAQARAQAQAEAARAAAAERARQQAASSSSAQAPAPTTATATPTTTN